MSRVDSHRPHFTFRNSSLLSWRCGSVIQLLGRPRQEHHKFKPCLCSLVGFASEFKIPSIKRLFMLLLGRVLDCVHMQSLTPRTTQLRAFVTFAEDLDSVPSITKHQYFLMKYYKLIILLHENPSFFVFLILDSCLLEVLPSLLWLS